MDDFWVGKRVTATPALKAASQHPTGAAIYGGVGIVIGLDSQSLMVHWPSGAVGPHLPCYVEDAD